MEVGNDYVGQGFAEREYSVEPVGCGEDVIALILQEGSRGFAYRRLIIHNEDTVTKLSYDPCC
jgi:hypothetical protein